MPLTDEHIARIDAQIGAYEEIQKFLERTSEGLEGVVSSAAWFVAVVSPGFLGIVWNAKSMSEYSRLEPVWFYGVFVAAQACFLASIVSSILVHRRGSRLIGDINEQQVHISAVAMALGSTKRSGEVPADTTASEIAFRTSLHDLETELSKGTPRHVEWASRAYAPLGIAGYVLVGVILVAATFEPKVGCVPSAAKVLMKTVRHSPQSVQLRLPCIQLSAERWLPE